MLLAIHAIKSKQNTFVDVDISTNLNELYKYDVCIFEILIGTESRYLNLKKLPNLSSLEINFHQWMANRSYEGYSTVASKKYINELTVKQYSLQGALHLLKHTNSLESIDSERPIEQCRDIAMKLSTNTDFLVENTLMTVNGYIHNTVSNSEHIYILEGNMPYRHKGILELEMLDFSNLGGIKTFPITTTSVIEVSGNSCYLQLPYSLSDGLTPFVVVLGQLHILTENSETITLINDTTIKLDIDNLGERILRAIADKIIVPSDLNLTINEGEVFVVSELLSEETLKKALGLSISFGGFINKSNVYVRRRKLENVLNSNMAHLNKDNKNPILNATGQLVQCKYNDESKYLTYSIENIKEEFRLSNSLWKKDLYVKFRMRPVDRLDDEPIYEYFIHGE